MIRVLIIDDDSIKINDVCSILNEFKDIPRKNIEYDLEVKNALYKLETTVYDLLILDIKLPNIIGSETISNGGCDLLDCIIHTDRIKKPNHIIGLTSFDDSFNIHSETFDNNLLALLKYSKTSNDWKEKIRNKIKYLLKWKSQVNEIKITDKHDYDIAIITTVEREYESVLDLDCGWETIPIANDSSQYKKGIIIGKDKRYKIVVAKQLQMGMPAASVLTMKMIYNFRPKYICMLGLAAGKRDKVKLGDIIISAESWDYGSGKIRENSQDNSSYVFEPEPHQISIDAGLREIFSQDFSETLFHIRKMWNKKNAKEINTDLKLFLGPLASGASVIQDKGVVASYIDPQNRKLLGLDMETYGVYFAASNCHQPKPQYISIKAVCDFADEKKNDNYQAYACFVSSQFFYRIVGQELLP